MVTCPFCGTKNLDTVHVCKLCKRSLRRHKNRWKRWGSLIALGVFLIVTIFTLEYFSNRAEMIKMAEQKKAVIELTSSYGYRTRFSLMVVEGKVRNVSAQKLQGVYAIVTWFDKDSQVVAKEKTFLRDDILVSYQTSAFVVKLPHEPSMERYAISFETEDGTVLLSSDTRTAREELSFAPEGQ